MEHPYVVTSPCGELVLRAGEECRYSKRIELALMDAGYTIRLNGRKLTKKEVRA